ncbi:2-octaprenyl-6-methoxyphenol hydroxylase [Labrys monachus]|uniref:2-octaprenyl-6-methoxyphenol hydroxylase n=1 Tax=Labrys monachus TaxID=217067 RepID=A0ABU0FEA8_9HYPH|nr:2-octaprenyl-6-methoxyphenol hydroxylase [Labrys monachus]
MTLIGHPGNPGDTRTTALLDGSIDALARLGIDIPDHEAAAPLRVMAIVDATQRLLRARPIRFEAREIGLDAFGWNIPNGALAQALTAALAATDIDHIAGRLAGVEPGDEEVGLTLDGGEALTADLVIAADGRNSIVREAAGIATTRHDYPQTALAVNLRIGRDHREVSTEFHTEAGPFTLVPLPGRRASLVWVMAPDKAEALERMTDEELASAIERQSHALLGRIEIDSPRSFWPMTSIMADSYARRRIALVGEAAHVFPPIGAQGFNLTLRDISALADAVAGRADPGSAPALDAYARARSFDASSRRSMVDLLNRSLLSGQVPLQGLRGLGLYALERIGPLRRAMMRQGLARSVEH